MSAVMIWCTPIIVGAASWASNGNIIVIGAAAVGWVSSAMIFNDWNENDVKRYERADRRRWQELERKRRRSQL